MKSSALWEAVRTFHLTTNQRARHDLPFADYVCGVGDGVAPGPPEDQQPGGSGDVRAVYIPKDLPDTPSHRGQICLFTDPVKARAWLHEGVRSDDARALSKRVLLCPHNATAAMHNAVYLDQLGTAPITCTAAHSMTSSSVASPAMATSEYMASIDDPGTPPAVLQLKVGAVLLVIRNLVSDQRIYNGTKVVVARIHQSMLVVRTIPGDATEQPRTVFLPRILFTINQHSISFTRRQFPVRLAYATSVNKSQGATLERACVDLSNGHCFGHGQLYVAVSRVQGRDRLAFLLPSGTDNSGANPVVVMNTVYKEVLGSSRLLSLHIPRRRDGGGIVADESDTSDGDADGEDGGHDILLTSEELRQQLQQQRRSGGGSSQQRGNSPSRSARRPRGAGTRGAPGTPQSGRVRPREQRSGGGRRQGAGSCASPASPLPQRRRFTGGDLLQTGTSSSPATSPAHATSNLPIDLDAATYSWAFVPVIQAVVGLESDAVNRLSHHMGVDLWDRLITAYQVDFQARGIVIANIYSVGVLQNGYVYDWRQEQLLLPPASLIDIGLYNEFALWASDHVGQLGNQNIGSYAFRR